MKFPKYGYIRSAELMQNARKIPCQHCGRDDGTVVAAHTNFGGGKGRGIKASDNLIASLCYPCHMEIDQGVKLDKETRKQIWLAAHHKTVRKLRLYNLWPSNVPLPEDLP